MGDCETEEHCDIDIPSDEIGKVIWPMHLGWSDIVKGIRQYKQQCPDKLIWKLLEEKPITKESIDELIRNGWGIEIIDDPRLRGNCAYERKKIELNRTEKGLDRDITLMHEVYHAIYGSPSYECLFGLSAFWPMDCVAEFASRPLIVDQELLHHTLQAFNLEPQEYSLEDHKEYLPPLKVTAIF